VRRTEKITGEQKQKNKKTEKKKEEVRKTGSFPHLFFLWHPV